MPDEKEKKIKFFNFSINEEHNKMFENFNSTSVETVKLKPIVENGVITNKDAMLAEMLGSDEGKQPILNIQLDSNLQTPPIEVEDLENIHNLGIKVCFTINNYYINTENKLGHLLEKADHVFFTKKEAEKTAIASKSINLKKISNVEYFQAANLVENEILKRPPNILILGDSFPINGLAEATVAVKQNNARLIIAVNSSTPEQITEFVSSKFNINELDQKLGLKLEIADLLQDKVNGPKKLEAYITKLSQQFQKDLGKSEINPIDIHFTHSAKELKEITNQAKYTVNFSSEPIQSIANGCIRLQKGHLSEELRTRENNSSINKTSLKEMQYALDQYKPANVVEKILKVLQTLSRASKSLVNKEQTHKHISQAHLLKQKDYLYTEDDIAVVLKHSIKPDTVIINHASLTELDLLKGTLMNTIYGDLIADGNKSAVIPLNTGNEHWVSMVIKHNKDNGALTFIYNDPLGKPIENRPELVKIIKEIVPEARIHDLKTLQQLNNTDCGPFMVDNLIKLAAEENILSTVAAKSAPKILRDNHADIVLRSQALSIGSGKMEPPGSEPYQHPVINHSNKLITVGGRI